MNIIDLEMCYLAKVAGGGEINNLIRELKAYPTFLPSGQRNLRKNDSQTFDLDTSDTIYFYRYTCKQQKEEVYYYVKKDQCDKTNELFHIYRKTMTNAGCRLRVGNSSNSHTAQSSGSNGKYTLSNCTLNVDNTNYSIDYTTTRSEPQTSTRGYYALVYVSGSSYGNFMQLVPCNEETGFTEEDAQIYYNSELATFVLLNNPLF